ncbi:ATP-binding cassette domain-containing protein [Lactiplantibacillus paraplantarum]|uniref:ABC transporter ATP-binding protein n=1 Tax=Lactiplantibacillus paraplantarum TaxID=60520 RepID=UPI0021A4C88D|nr:ATP-binding cassette domain-containing protein [Lactiplantibacillus paraplantarum]MCT4457903.1 ATP-binding cassette domain-containing protein [Lactiplantibacillus paraplantarum]
MNGPLLTVTQLDKYFGHQHVLKTLTFTLQKGHIVALIGANGAGKTTLMKSILGLTSFTGKICLNDQPITPRHHQVLSAVGALIEYPGLYPFLTGRQQLKLFATGAHRTTRVTTIIEALHLQAFADILTKRYSLGMRQKLGIALALLNQPALVILDEPMNGLDPQATKELRNLILRAQASGTTFLISSHILSELQRVADDVLVIDHGQLIVNTSMPALLAQHRPTYELVTNQDQRAYQLLQSAGYQLVTTTPISVLITPGFQLNSLLELLLTNQIQLQHIQSHTEDLESTLLALLKQVNYQGGQA